MLCHRIPICLVQRPNWFGNWWKPFFVFSCVALTATSKHSRLTWISDRNSLAEIKWTTKTKKCTIIQHSVWRNSIGLVKFEEPATKQHCRYSPLSFSYAFCMSVLNCSFKSKLPFNSSAFFSNSTRKYIFGSVDCLCVLSTLRHFNVNIEGYAIFFCCFNRFDQLIIEHSLILLFSFSIIYYQFDVGGIHFFYVKAHAYALVPI